MSQLHDLPNISCVLLGLADRFFNHNSKRKIRPFTLAQLLAWAPALQHLRAARTICNLLATKGLLAPVWADDTHARLNQNASNPPRWELTDSGKAAVHAAKLGAASRKKSETMTRVNEDRQFPSSLPQKLWTVLRARRSLTSIEAAELLCDAGDDVTRLRKQISNYLRSWHALIPEQVQLSKKRVDGYHRYVLIGDVGRFPPESLRNAPALSADKKKMAEAQE